MIENNLSKLCVVLLFSFLLFTKSIKHLNANEETPGIEKIGNIFHLWNRNLDFYINDTGIQITNHYGEYWTHNLWCIESDDGSMKKCFDKLEFDWNNVINENFVELIGKTRLEDFSIQLKYHLTKDSRRIGISVELENLGRKRENVSFVWKINNIKVDNTYEDDTLHLFTFNNTPLIFNLSKDLNVNFTHTKIKKHLALVGKGGLCKAVHLWWGPFIRSENAQEINSTLLVKSEKDEHNAPITLIIHLGNIDREIIELNFYWIDSPGCVNAGFCGELSRNACGACVSAGCYWNNAINMCRGTLDCSVYSDQSSCEGCSVCTWEVADWLNKPTVHSPENTTYDTHDLTLNVTCVGSKSSYYVNRSLDGGDSVIFGIAQNNTPFANTTTLSGLSEGSHNVIVSCYNDTLINTSDPIYFTIAIPPTYSLNSTNSTTAGTPVKHSLFWEDDTGLSYAIFSFDNCTGTLENISTLPLSGTSAWSNFSVIINETIGCTIRWCVYANDTLDNWNGTSCQNPFTYITTPPQQPPSVYRPETFNESNAKISTFNLFEKVIIRVNVSDSDIDKVLLNLTASNGTPIYTNTLMINTTISCGSNCWVFEKNYTLQGGDPAGTWIINITANDTANNQDKNSTTFNVSFWIEIIPSLALLNGVFYGLVNTSSTDNPAINDSSLPNGGTAYNITVGSASNTKVDFYHKLNESFPTGITKKAQASITNETHGFSSSVPLTTTWQIIGDSSVNCTNVTVGGSCWIRFYLDVSPSVQPGTYERMYQYCGIFAGGDPSYCG